MRVASRLIVLFVFVLCGGLYLFFRHGSDVPAPEAGSASGRPLHARSEAVQATAIRATEAAAEDYTPVKLAYASEVVIREPEFLAFNQWAESYINAQPENRASMEAEGVRLAGRRRDEMEDLIQADPRRAIELAFPRVQRRILPPSVRQLLEIPIKGWGDLMLAAATPAPGQTVKPSWRTAHLNEEVFEAHVYGRRLEESSRLNILLHGVAIGKHLAVEEFPVRIMGADEVAEYKSQPKAAASELCEISGERADAQGTEMLLDGGDEVIPVCSREHAEQLQRELAEGESENGLLGASSAETAPSTYTEGIKSVIIIRVDFSDNAGEPFSLSAGTNLVTGLDRFFREMSYGKTGWSGIGGGSAITPTFRLPRTAAWYGERDASILRTDARDAASAGGYVLSRYQFDLICFSQVPGFNWAGLGYVGVPGSWISGGASLGVTAHELGHNLGLNHANFWDTGGVSVMGSGSEEEYGDKFDTMGSASAGSKHFNARYKSYLNWLTAGDIRIVSGSGTYRLFPHDDPNATGVRALRTARNNMTNYWLEYRTRYGGNKWMPQGLGIRWARTGNQSSVLLDLTPGSPNGKDDAQLAIGRTFSDPVAGVHITPIGKGGTTPESLDVVINRGSFIGNLPPRITLEASLSSSAVNAPIDFQATAFDPNADALAYYWEFGDGSFGSNTPAITKRWSVSGEYAVRCTVSDMKGKEASTTMLVRVGSPSTYRLSGRVLNGTRPMPGVKVSASSSKVTSTDSDGRYYLTGLPSGTYTLHASHEGFIFSRSGFANPVQVPVSNDSADFYALPVNA